MKHRFLIIFELCPENLKVFSLETDDSALCEQVRACHKQFGNTLYTDDDIQEFINSIDQIAKLIYSDESEEDNKRFANPVKLTGLLNNVEIIHTGFML